MTRARQWRGVCEACHVDITGGPDAPVHVDITGGPDAPQRHYTSQTHQDAAAAWERRRERMNDLARKGPGERGASR